MRSRLRASEATEGLRATERVRFAESLLLGGTVVVGLATSGWFSPSLASEQPTALLLGGVVAIVAAYVRAVAARERTLFALAFGAASIVGISAFRSYLEGRRSVFHFELLLPLGATLLAIKIAEAVGARVTRVDRP